MLVEAIRQEKNNLFKQGEAKKAQEIARTMLEEGLAIELIMKVTKLSKKEIERLKNGV